MNRCFKTVWFPAAVLFAMALVSNPSVSSAAGPATVCKKEIPVITFENLTPPFKDHDYFRDHGTFPFESSATAFSLVNAWWLSEASTLVYADEAYARQRFEKAGLNRVKFFDRTSAQFFIAANSRFAIVAFRGSEIWKKDEGFDAGRMIADFKTDIDIRLSGWVRGGRVHSGFKAALEGVWDDLLPEIQKLDEEGVAIWVTGHSLGAALATLAADRLDRVQGLYTFGSPRVGDYEFQRRFRPKNAFRFVNGKDIVARVPPYGRFRHVGKPKFIGREDDDLREPPGEIECSGNPGADDSAGGDGKSVSSVLIPDSIRDHVPLLVAQSPSPDSQV